MCIVFMRKQPPGGHFEFPISVDLPYGMSLHLAILSPNMKTIGPTLWPLHMVINRQNGHQKGAPGGHLEFPYAVNIRNL